MFREAAESLRQQLEEALSLRVVFADTANGVSQTTPFEAAEPTGEHSSPSTNSPPSLALVWLGAKEFVSRRTPAAYDQSAVHVSGKLEYLAFARGLPALENTGDHARPTPAT